MRHHHIENSWKKSESLNIGILFIFNISFKYTVLSHTLQGAWSAEKKGIPLSKRNKTCWDRKGPAPQTRNWRGPRRWKRFNPIIPLTVKRSEPASNSPARDSKLTSQMEKSKESTTKTSEGRVWLKPKLIFKTTSLKLLSH